MKLVFLIVGYLSALSLIPCVVLLVKKHQRLTAAERFEGEVVGYEARRGGKGRSASALKVKYKDGSGRSHLHTTKAGSNPPARRVGERVLVFHHQDGSCDILVFTHLYLGYWIWLCAGVAFGGGAIVPLLLNLIYERG